MEHPETEPRPPMAGALAPWRRRFVAAALAGDRRSALEIAKEALAVAGAPLDVYVEVFQEGLYDIGLGWQTGAVGIADEHVATAVTQFVLAALYPALVQDDGSRGNAVVTGVAGELHDMGARIVADAWEADGWNVRFLGTDLPPEAAVKAIREHGARVVGVSITMARHAPQAARLIAGMRASGPPRPFVVIGGRACREDRSLAAAVGADATASDVRDAVGLLRARAPAD